MLFNRTQYSKTSTVHMPFSVSIFSFTQKRELFKKKM